MIIGGNDPVGYQHIADVLRHAITTGELRPGARLPSERTIMQTYGVAEKTARRAVDQIRSEGLAMFMRGYGVVVRAQQPRETVWIDAEDRVSSRNPTPSERETYEMPEGVPLLVVTHADGLMDLWPAHRYELATRGV
ncbi:winged helix-turn-helix domain-containing protein [Verrucosispora sp. SN26_14.1]|uniref:winged helix-turn-helix domain-containing protein n=1 Tax=Verrucosispora sp. SN26_14.1 TaxID=2527879 RepID=UPI00137570B0|nr:winged helix-turn-helix domain-containing protein [Verrucosispora sp. SN26_14.1]